ncbi:MAG: hypothetical protein HDT09_04535 [Bacteroidales bacterium]|nr:hypothetical protein [Bacteroidales bacterium]
MKNGLKRLRLSTAVLMLALIALGGTLASCGTIRTHGGVEFENEFRPDGHHKHKKEKKPKHKKPKHHHKHHHDD